MKMTPEKIPTIKERLYSILSSLRNQNSAADIHSVGNMRHTSSLLLEQLEQDPDCITDELAEQIVKNIERNLVFFYQRKYR